MSKNTAPKIFIVTPSYNASETLDRTISSVVLQAGNFDLHYHIQDGGSNDGTVEILEKWQRRIQIGMIPLLCNSISFTYSSTKDGGMYDAIYQAFNSLDIEPNDWMTWINADDIILPGSCAFIAQIDHQKLHQVCWITNGMISIDKNNVPIANGERPMNKQVIGCGLCDGNHWDYVQQEGTFFRNSLWRSVDLDKDFKSFKYAGDWSLWMAFAQNEEIYTPSHALGRFNKREGQISHKFRGEYIKEINQTIDQNIRSQKLLSLSSENFYRLILKTRYPEDKIEINKTNDIADLLNYRKSSMIEQQNAIEKNRHANT